MSATEAELLKKLLQVFATEAEERLKVLSLGLFALEQETTAEAQAGTIENLFREMHNLKGAARAVNKLEVETVCQTVEDIFEGLKQQRLSLSPPLLDALHQAIDLLERLLVEAGDAAQISTVVTQLERFKTEPSALPTQPAPIEAEEPARETPPPLSAAKADAPVKEAPALPEKPAADQAASTKQRQLMPSAKTIRIATSKLDALLFQVEEMLSVKLTVQQHALELRNVADAFDLGRKEWLKVAQEVPLARQALSAVSSLNGDGNIPASLSRLLTFFDWYQSYSQALEHKLKSLTWLAEQDQQVLGGMVDNLLEEMKLALMSPCSYLLDIFPKMVRDIARAQEKEVALVTRGGEVEVDRRILEEMKDPLMHLVRNCLDHGLETPTERRQHNKPAQGTLTLIVSQVAGGKVEMVISDDGRGIDLEKVKAAAIKQGFLSTVEAKGLSQAEATALIFQSALSTSAAVTELSGRGLGMAIVQEKVEKLGGKIWVETSPQNGSTFRILLPLTLATFRGVLVEVADQVFIVPTMNVERVVRVEQANIKTVQGRETICLNGRTLPLVSLAEILEFPTAVAKDAASPFSQIIILNATNKTIAFRVDAVLKEQEVLVKNLGKQLVRVRNVAAAAVLASGQVAPILDVSDLIKSAVNRGGVSRPAISPVKPEEAKQPAILVVDDSITSRVLLKNILEAAGYQTQTAIDGLDALTLLKEGSFDLVVSDVEMPRLNGFDLTAKIRSDGKLADLPLVLVTSLDDPRERERGIEVGANAYIVKGSLDQSNLLSVIQRLI